MIFKGLKRKIAGLMALVMVFTSVPFTAMAEGTGAVDGTQYLSETGISPELISDGMFYFATEAAEFNEGDAGSYLLKVGRYGSFDTEASVRVKFVDISTKYGTDYRVRVLNDVASVMNIGKARSLIEYLSEGEQDEYNYTDAIIDGTVNSLNILTGNESLSEGEQAAMMSDLSYVTGAITGGSAAVNGGGVSTATPSDAASSNKNAENKNGEAGGETNGSGNNGTGNNENANGGGENNDGENKGGVNNDGENNGGVNNDGENNGGVNNDGENKGGENKGGVNKGGVNNGGENNGSENNAGENNGGGLDEIKATPSNAKLSLSEAWELSNGMTDDKEPLENSNTGLYDTGLLTTDSPASMDESLDAVADELNSAYIDIHFKANESEKYIKITILNNDEAVGERLAQFLLTSLNGSEVAGAYEKCILTIYDDEEAPEASLYFGETELYPENGYVTVDIYRTGNVNVLCTAMIDSYDVTAEAGTEYSKVHAELVFVPGVTKRSIKVPVRTYALEEEKEFTLKLQEAKNCTIDTESASVTIAPEDDTFANDILYVDGENVYGVYGLRRDIDAAGVLLSDDGDDDAENSARSSGAVLGGILDVVLGDKIKLQDKVKANSTSGSGSKSEPAFNGYGWKLYLEDSYNDVNGSVTFDLTDNGKLRYDYSGIEIKWKNESGKPTYGYSSVEYSGTGSGQTTLQHRDNDTRFDLTERLYFPSEVATWVGVHMTRNYGFWGTSPTLTIDYIKPMMRPYQISLAASEPVKFIDPVDGTYKNNTAIKGMEKFNTVRLENANAGTVTTTCGQSVQLTLDSAAQGIVYIEGIDIVSNDGTKVRNLVSGIKVGTNTVSIDITNDLISDNRDYVTFSDIRDHGKYGSFKLRAHLAPMPAKVEVVRDSRADIELWDGKGGVAVPSQTEGGIDTYTKFNVGDAIRYTVKLKDGFESICNWSTLKLEVTEPYGYKGHRIERDAGTDSATEVIEYSGIKITPVIEKLDNKVIVRVLRDILPYFDTTKGIFTIEPVRNGSYNDYVVSDGKAVAGVSYELEAYTKDTAFIATWQQQFTDKTKYSQNTFYFTGEPVIEKNVINLTVDRAAATKFVLRENIKFEETVLGGKSAGEAWLNAEGSAIMLGRTTYGIADPNGNCVTMPFASVAGNSVRYKLMSNGAETICSAVLKAENEGDVIDIGGESIKAYINDLGNVTAGVNSDTRPHINAFKATTNMGESDIAVIDDGIMTKFEIRVQETDPNTGEKYKYTYTDKDGISRTAEESIKNVEIIVVDPVTKKMKMVLSGNDVIKSEFEEGLYTAGKTFTPGKYSQYKAGDVIYVRIVTDRKCGDGSIPALNHTPYAPVNTNVYFKEKTPEQTEPLDIDLSKFVNRTPMVLPIIDKIMGIVSVTGFKLSVEKTQLGYRFYYGLYKKNWKSNHFDSKGKLINDAGYSFADEKTFDSDFAEMANTIKNFGHENYLGAMSLFLKPFEVTPIAGIYLEFIEKRAATPEGTIAESIFLFAGGGMYIGIVGKLRFTYYMVLSGVPFYLGVMGQGKFLGELGFATGEVPKSMPTKMDNAFLSALTGDANFQFVFRATFDVTAFAGLGAFGLVGVRGGFNIRFQYIANPTVKYMYPAFKTVHGFKVKGSIKMWIEAVLATITIPVYSFKDWVKMGYFEELDKLEKEGALGASGAAGQMAIGAHPSDGLSSDGKWNSAPPTTGNGTYEIADSRVIQSDGYDDANVRLMSYRYGGKDYALLVFLDEVQGDNPYDRTRLKYSVYDADSMTWTEPRQVWIPDNTSFDAADLAPDLCDAGGRILITWTSRNKELPDTSSYKKIYESLDINAAWFDKADGTIKNVATIASDDYYNRMPTAVYDSETGDVCVLYYKSEVTDINNAQDFIDNANTEQNNSYLAYVLYDAAENKWMTEAFYANEYTELGEQARQQLLSSFNGQRLMASPVSGVANNPVITDITQGTLQFAQIIAMPSITPEEAEQYEQLKQPAGTATPSVYVNNSAVAVYTVDTDKKASTNYDRELFVQQYDFTTHRYGDPVQLTNDLVAQSSPQLINAGNETYLFWIEDGKMLKYVDGATLYESVASGDLLDPEKIRRAEIKEPGTNEDAVFEDYRAFVDKSGNIYIAWSVGESSFKTTDAEGNPVSEDGDVRLTFTSDIYMASLWFDEPDSTGKLTGSHWSDAVKITNTGEKNGKINNIPAIADVGHDNVILVNNNYVLTDNGASAYSISGNELVETRLNYACSVELGSYNISFDETRTDENGNVEITVSAELENTGLTYSKAVTGSLRIKDGDSIKASFDIEKDKDGTVHNIDIAPGGSLIRTGTLKVPKAVIDNPDKLTLELAAYETAPSGETVTKKSSKSLKGDIVRKAAFERSRAKQHGDTIDVTVAIVNDGSLVIPAGSTLKFYDGHDTDTVIASVVIDSAINPGQGTDVSKTIDIPEKLSGYAYMDIGYRLYDDMGKDISGLEYVQGYIETPYNLSVNGVADGGTITIKEGETIDLTIAYSPDDYYVNAPGSYAVQEGHIADVRDGNKLTGYNAGETTLYASTNPFGGQAKIKIVVEAKPPVVDPDDGDDDVVTKKTVISGPADSVELSNGSWQQNANGTWMFFNGDGTLKTGWGHTGTGDNKTYYHFNEKGVMETGWILVDGDWYYMSEIKDSSEGAMQRNWHLDSQDGRWYYLDPVTGKMLTGWQKINGKWYYMSPAILAPTWMKDLDDKYHYIGGGRPYGSMYVNEYTPDGYRVGPDGAWIP